MRVASSEMPLLMRNTAGSHRHYGCRRSPPFSRPKGRKSPRTQAKLISANVCAPAVGRPPSPNRKGQDTADPSLNQHKRYSKRGLNNCLKVSKRPIHKSNSLRQIFGRPRNRIICSSAFRPNPNSNYTPDIGISSTNFLPISKSNYLRRLFGRSRSHTIRSRILFVDFPADSEFDLYWAILRPTPKSKYVRRRFGRPRSRILFVGF